MSKSTVLVLVLLPIALAACGPSPVKVGEQVQAAINSGDVDTALGLFAPDAVLAGNGIAVGAGNAGIGEWLAVETELNLHINGSPVGTDSGVVFEDCSLSSDMWSFFALDMVTASCEATIESGQITALTIQLDHDTETRIADSMMATGADLIGVWITQNYISDVGDLYLQFFEDGSARLAGTSEDLMTSPDSEHPGASLTWTYLARVLTIRNSGPATEGYCQVEDVGNYLVATVDEGGLKFNPINDSCSLRKVAFRLPPRWRPSGE